MSYLKVTVTVAPFAPEISVPLAEKYVPPILVEDLEEAFPCYGALLHVTVAPVLIGSGRPSLTLPAIAELDQALRPRCRTFRVGEDVLFDLDLR